MNTQLNKYLNKVSRAQTKGELVAKLNTMDRSLAADGLRIAMSMTDGDFIEWKDGLARYNNGETNSEAWENKYLDLLIPTPVAKMRLFLEEVEPYEFEGRDYA